MKFKVLLIGLFIFMGMALKAQTKKEQEFRIDEELFPTNAAEVLRPFLTGTKRIRYYKEFDGEKVSYEAKFKKDRLRYSIEFDQNGNLEDAEFIIKSADIPDSTFETIKNHLESNHQKYRIKKIQQQYPCKTGNASEVLKTAFQNLILPEINYEIIIASKDDSGYVEHEVTFNADGEYILSRRLVKQGYDHVLY
ncbi:hypothetical protein ACFSQJ_06170 [Croceitalea marina]|uniref:PepSY domain-containing protein n=1 Tax=Croceitalea marina TaxID=1775166 RepID=A0ABW5MUN6_9FLAO